MSHNVNYLKLWIFYINSSLVKRKSDDIIKSANSKLVNNQNTEKIIPKVNNRAHLLLNTICNSKYN